MHACEIISHKLLQRLQYGGTRGGFFSSCTAVADCDREELAGGWDRKRVRKGCNKRMTRGNTE